MPAHTSTRHGAGQATSSLPTLGVCRCCKGNTHLSSSLPSTRQPSQRLSAAVCNVISRFYDSTRARLPDNETAHHPPPPPPLTVQCPLATPEPSPLVASRPEPKLSLRRRARAAALCPSTTRPATTRHDTAPALGGNLRCLPNQRVRDSTRLTGPQPGRRNHPGLAASVPGLRAPSTHS